MLERIFVSQIGKRETQEGRNIFQAQFFLSSERDRTRMKTGRVFFLRPEEKNGNKMSLICGIERNWRDLHARDKGRRRFYVCSNFHVAITFFLVFGQWFYCLIKYIQLTLLKWFSEMTFWWFYSVSSRFRFLIKYLNNARYDQCFLYYRIESLKII